MSKNLHYTIITYFKSRMNGHSRVEGLDDISTEEHYIYRISRKGGLSQVVVWLSDAYGFSRAEFLTRPRKPKIDYVLIARPEVADSEPSSENWDGIGVGNIAGFMGALNKEQVFKYTPPRRKN